MTIVDQHASTVGVTDACRTVGVSRATWYRHHSGESSGEVRERARSHPRRLSDAERQQVIDVLCCKEFADRAPREVYATLLRRGEYLCSVRTMYRILRAQKAVRERRSQRIHPAITVPRCCATAPNQLWSWDITKLRGPLRTWFSLYVVLDVFSRFVVTWLLARRESGYLAARLIEQAILAAGIDRDQLTVHADRGAPMTSKSIVELLADLRVERSHSRPRVSSDNPYSESQFKTLKYCPEYPGRFDDVIPGRVWCASFFGWHNYEHHHEGIGFLTPADVYFGRHLEVDRVRKRALDTAYALHPERFVRGRPTPPALPTEVWINRPTDQDIVIGSGGFGPLSPSGGSQGCGGRRLRPPRARADQLELVGS